MVTTTPIRLMIVIFIQAFNLSQKNKMARVFSFNRWFCSLWRSHFRSLARSLTVAVFGAAISNPSVGPSPMFLLYLHGFGFVLSISISWIYKIWLSMQWQSLVWHAAFTLFYSRPFLHLHSITLQIFFLFSFSLQCVECYCSKIDHE